MLRVAAVLASADEPGRCRSAARASTHPTPKTTMGAVTESTPDHAKIDAHVWQPFARSYSTLDIDLFASILHHDHVRIGTHGVTDSHGYIEETRRGFDRARGLGDTLSIEFRFDQRLHGDGCAFDLGTFSLRITSISGTAQNFTGRFRAISRHTLAGWKLLVDEDGGPIDPAQR